MKWTGNLAASAGIEHADGIADIAAEAVEENVKEIGRIGTYFQGKLPAAIDFLIQIGFVAALFVVFRKLIKIVLKMLERSFARAEMEAASAHFTLSVIEALLYILLAAVLATFLGVEGTSVAALIGSMGVGIVLALKESLSNIAGGFILLFMKPFVSGDYIHEDSKGNEGTVVKIDLFYTTLLTVDNRTVCIPNGVLSNSSLTNYSRQDKRQLREHISISYHADIMHAKKVLEDILKKDAGILQEEPVEVMVDSLGDHGVILAWHAWVSPTEYFKTRWRITEQIKYEFDREEIEIPYQQLDVYLGRRKLPPL